MTYDAIVEDEKTYAQNGHPLAKFAGMFQDDPLFDEFVEEMAAYRREVDAETSE